MQISEDMQQVLDHGMALLRTDMVVRILQQGRWSGLSGDVQPQSPYLYAVSHNESIVKGAQTPDTNFAWATWRAMTSEAATVAGATSWIPTNSGVRVQLALPEAIFTDLFAASSQTIQRAGYVNFRNSWYLRLAARVQTYLPDVVAALDTDAAPQLISGSTNFTSISTYQDTVHDVKIGAVTGAVTLASTDYTKRGVFTLDIDLPQKCLRTPDHLAALRDLIWLCMGIGDGEQSFVDFARTFYTHVDPIREVMVRLNKVGAGADNKMRPEFLPGFGNSAPSQQLLLRAGLDKGAGLTPLTSSMWVLDQEKRHVVIAGRYAGLNRDVAVRLTHNRDALMRQLGTHGLVVPRGMTYGDVDQALADFERSFAHKSIFVSQVATDGQAHNVAMMTPPTKAQFASVLRRLRGQMMVQLLAPGSLYRCLVLDGHILGVQAHEYAYVVGDGHHDVATLLSAKRERRDALGQPTLGLSDGVRDVLARQNVTVDSIIPRGTQVFLGHDTDAFDAGEYWDDRDSLDSSYDAIVVKAANVVGLRYCTVDIAVINGFMPYSNEAPGMVQVVGVDPAPDLATFAQPTIGTGRDYAPTILRAAWSR